MEVKDFTFEMKADADARTIEGLGSVFGNVDQGNDIVLPGAFTKSLKSGKPAMLWQHKADNVIGVWDEMRETGEGLYVKGRILETTLGNDVYTLAKAGALSGMSIGYGVKDSSIDRKTGVRQLKELKLYEVSLVTFPMNDRATITRVKSAGDSEALTLIEKAIEMCEEGELKEALRNAAEYLALPEVEPGFTPKSIERILREAGMSRGDAKGVIAKGYTAIAAPREAGEQEHDRLVKFINSLKS